MSLLPIGVLDIIAAYVPVFAQVGERQVSTEDGEALAGEWNIPFIETSAKDRINVEEGEGDLRHKKPKPETMVYRDIHSFDFLSCVVLLVLLFHCFFFFVLLGNQKQTNWKKLSSPWHDSWGVNKALEVARNEIIIIIIINHSWIIIIHGSSSFMDHHHSWIIIIHGSSSFMDHHHSWIIIIHGSSSFMDHHHSWIIIIHGPSSSSSSSYNESSSSCISVDVRFSYYIR